MLDPPNIAEEVIRKGLLDSFGIPVAKLEFLPIGADPAAWAYRAQSEDGTLYFLKLRRAITHPSSLTVPHYLHEHGVTEVIAPIAAKDGSLFAKVPDFVLVLYPYLEETPGMGATLDKGDWVRYGSVLRRIHGVAVTPELKREMRRETFVSRWIGELRALDEAITSGAWSEPVQKEWAALFNERRPRIKDLVRRYEELGQALAAAAPPFVLCHADIHMNNILVNDSGGLWVVDWDEAILAPKECDLFFGIGGFGPEFVSPQQEAWFREGYGETTINTDALTYYRCERAVSDIASYGASALLDPEAGLATKEQALDRFNSTFKRGNIFDMAEGAA